MWMAAKIRKVCIGPDYKDGMKYTVGQEYAFGYIHQIVMEGQWLNVYIFNKAEKAITLWKWWNVNTVPIHFEADQNF